MDFTPRNEQTNLSIISNESPPILNFLESNGSLTEPFEESSFEYGRHIGVWNQIIISFVYVFGIVGNISALFILAKKENKRFQKQTLMIKCLSLNDLTALLGSAVLMNLRLYVVDADPKWICVVRVIWRAFGLGSGCIAFIMTLERWFALTRPFLYHKRITLPLIARGILILWLINVLVVCAPFLGFGLWYDETSDKPCLRYRFGTLLKDRIYAYVVFCFGMSMCLIIVGCNMSVMRVLCSMGGKIPTRRHSRLSNRSSSSGSASTGEATPDELSFARLMAIISIFFVICWVPQMLTIMAAQHSLLPKASPCYRIADILIAMNFTLDPYLYVIFRRKHLCQRRQQWSKGDFSVSAKTRDAQTSNSRSFRHSFVKVRREESGPSDEATLKVMNEKKFGAFETSPIEEEYLPLQILLKKELN